MNGSKRSIFITLLVLSLAAGVHRQCFGQAASMEYEGRRDVTLKDGTQVRCLLARGSTPDNPKYYYLPANLHLATSQDGTPQFLFLKFTTEKDEAQGGVNGALMHFLMEFGLTAAQQQELQGILRAGSPKPLRWHGNMANFGAPTAPVLLGAAPVVTDGDSNSFQIISATLSDTSMTKSLINSGKAPLVAGQRVAVAARLTGNGAQLLASTFEKSKSITDVSMNCNLAYYTMLPAVKGHIEFYGSKLQKESEHLRAEYSHTHSETHHGFLGLGGTDVHDSSNYSDSMETLKFLEEKGIVKMTIEQVIDNETTSKIRDAFLQMFLDSFTQKTEAPPPPLSDDTSLKAPDIGSINGLDRYRFKQDIAVTDRVWDLEARLPYKETMTLTGNLKDWYDAVRDNPKCVASVNLNDPFFTHRDIKFIMDLDAKDMFDSAVNYVTVNVRKKRSTGRDFEDHITMDAKYLKDNGVAAGVTYARGEDSNPDTYQYQAQWSLKGGNVYPDNPPWQTGSWEGVTLAPPVKPLKIDFEANLDDLKAKDITRCTAQIHFFEFGDEAEKNIQISTAKGDALVSDKIFMDRDQKNYAYRLIFNHKTFGKLVGPWVKNVSDEYIYATIPEDLLTEASFKERAQNAAVGVIEKVLDKAGVH